MKNYVSVYNQPSNNHSNSTNVKQTQESDQYHLSTTLNKMQHNIFQEKLINGLEWVLFIGLCIVSGWFAYGVVNQFVSGKTSFAQHEEPMIYYPATIIHFHLKPSQVDFSDVNISYFPTGTRFEKNLSIGENYFSLPGDNKTEVVSLESFESLYSSKKKYRDFRIIHSTPIKFNPKGLAGANFKVYHTLRNSGEANSWENSHILFTFTSIKNSPGVKKIWKDGKPLHLILSKNTYTRIDMEAEQYNFLEQKGDCQQESFYECIVSELESSDDFERCSKKCIPIVFSNLGKNYSTPFCKNDSGNEQYCAIKIVQQLMSRHDVESNCEKSCSRLQYLGQIFRTQPLNASGNSNTIYEIVYRIPNKNMYVSEEYLIYDEINVIGSVGGTLGMFIGFSMTGVVSWVFSKIRKFRVNM